MPYELTLTPSGHIQIHEITSGHDSLPKQDTDWIQRAADTFAESLGAGLFTLAATKPTIPLPSTFAYWKDFASLYLAELRKTPDSPQSDLPAINLPELSELNELFLSAPPMLGGEYLSPGVLLDMWLKSPSFLPASASSLSIHQKLPNQRSSTWAATQKSPSKTPMSSSPLTGCLCAKSDSSISIGNSPSSMKPRRLKTQAHDKPRRLKN